MKKTHPQAAILDKCRELIKLMSVHLNHFPRHEKYGLCQCIRDAAYDVYGLLVECQKRYHNKTTLTKLDVRHEQLRMFVNLAFELGYFAYHAGSQDRPAGETCRRYAAISVLIDDLGAMIGGWIRSLASAQTEKGVMA